jgi:hypothetical protein
MPHSALCAPEMNAIPTSPSPDMEVIHLGQAPPMSGIVTTAFSPKADYVCPQIPVKWISLHATWICGRTKPAVITMPGPAMSHIESMTLGCREHLNDEDLDAIPESK